MPCALKSCSPYVKNYYSLNKIVPLEQMGVAGHPPPSQIIDTPLPPTPGIEPGRPAISQIPCRLSYSPGQVSLYPKGET